MNHGCPLMEGHTIVSWDQSVFAWHNERPAVTSQSRDEEATKLQYIDLRGDAN